MGVSRYVARVNHVWRVVVATCFVTVISVSTPALSGEESFTVKTRIAGPGKYVVEVEGGYADHPERVLGLAQLYAAKFALKLGYGFFRITDTKRAIRCQNSKEFGSVIGGQAKVGNAFLTAKKKTPGFLDVKDFIAVRQNKLFRRPTKEQMQKVTAAFVSNCLAKGQ